MNAFQYMIEDVFNVPQFKEYFTTQDGRKIVCISYSTDVDTAYTEYGVDQGVSFRLTCKVDDYMPKKGDKIAFRNKMYKIDSYTADSFNLSYTILLKDLTKK